MVEWSYSNQEIERGCRRLGLRALADGKPGLARRFNRVLVRRFEPPEDRDTYIRGVGRDLLGDEATGPLLRDALRRQGQPEADAPAA